MAQHGADKPSVEKCLESYGLFPLLNCEKGKSAKCAGLGEMRRSPNPVQVYF